MSLINDALKKARQAQSSTPSREAVPQLRSPDQDHPVRRGSGFVIPFFITLLLIGGVAAGWMFFSRKPATDASPAAPVTATDSAQSAPVTPPVVDSIPAASAPKLGKPAPAVEIAVPTVQSNATVTSAVTPIAVPAAALPVLPPKLNGIFFNPKRPTAMVNNKLVSVGSRINQFTVTDITTQSVTLVRGSETNVLSLSE
jgi:hypothetical protein